MSASLPGLAVGISDSELNELFELVRSGDNDTPQRSRDNISLELVDSSIQDGEDEPKMVPQSNTEEQKKEMARQRDRRKYLRRKGKMRDLKRQVETLEHQLHQLSAHSSPEINEDAIEVDIKSRGDHEQLKILLFKLELVKSRLRSENTELRRQFREASQRAVFLSDILKAEHKLYYAHSSYFRLLKPLSLQACSNINSVALQKIYAFETQISTARRTGSVAGWQSRRFVDRGLFKFALGKTFHHTSLEFAAARTWSHMVDPTSVETVYSAAMNMRARLVQKVDNDNYVFLKEMASTDPHDNGALVKSALLVSRFKTSTGYRMIQQNLTKQQIEMQERSTGEPVDLHQDLWIQNEQLVWVELDEIGSDAFSCRFCGIVPTIGVSSYFWMTEIMLISIRSEMKLLGTRFSVQSS